MGGGVQTTACLIRYNETYDYVIMADTGDEMPEAYEYVETYLKPFCEQYGITWVTVSSDKYPSLYDHCIDRKKTPSMITRWCTGDYKITPIHRYIKHVLGGTKQNTVTLDVGFSLDDYTETDDHDTCDSGHCFL